MPHDYPVPADVLPPKKPAPKPLDKRAMRVIQLQGLLRIASPVVMEAFVRMPCRHVYVPDYDWDVLRLAVDKCSAKAFADWVARLRDRDAPVAIDRLEAALRGQSDPVGRLTAAVLST